MQILTLAFQRLISNVGYGILTVICGQSMAASLSKRAESLTINTSLLMRRQPFTNIKSKCTAWLDRTRQNNDKHMSTILILTRGWWERYAFKLLNFLTQTHSNCTKCEYTLRPLISSLSHPIQLGYHQKKWTTKPSVCMVWYLVDRCTNVHDKKIHWIRSWIKSRRYRQVSATSFTCSIK